METYAPISEMLHYRQDKSKQHAGSRDTKEHRRVRTT